MTTPNPGRRHSAPDTTDAPPDPARHDGDETTLRTHSEPGQAYTAKSSRSNLLLPRSPLVGRDHEIAAVKHLLLQEQVGLLTLTGPGGIGKTRLALQVAANLLDHFVDGAYFVSLAPISDPDLVIPAIAQTLGVREAGTRPLRESLQDYLRDRQLLLVLDNFEQVLAAAPFVAELLVRCQRLKTLVTSRATLHLYGEHEFPVPALALPDPKRITTGATDLVASLTSYAAVELFVQRAQAAKPDFVLTASNAAAVAEICIGLDGLPLAIELAASRVKLFPPLALLAGLKQRLTLLTGGPADLPARQRTLRNAIAWSYDLLTVGEQMLFRRLAVFVGGFTLEAAQAVGNPSTGSGQGLGMDVLDGVAALVDQNLLKQAEQSGGELRFDMLETIREYGLERLAASGEAEAIHRHHASFFLALAEAIDPELLEGQWKQALTQLERELDNLRAALVWSHTPGFQDDASKAVLGLRLAGALAWFAMVGHHVDEARGWLVATLQRATEPSAARAKALWGAGLMAWLQGNYPMARAELEESVALWRTLGDPRGLAVALRELCLVAHFQRQFMAAQRYGEESVALCRALGLKWQMVLALDNLAYAVAAQGDSVAARTLFEEENTLVQALGTLPASPYAIAGLGWLAAQQGDYATAHTHFVKVLALQRTDGNKWSVAEALNLLGEVLQRQGELEQASHLFCEGLVLVHEVGDKVAMAHFLHHLGTLAQTQRQHERAACLLAVAAARRNLTEGVTFRTFDDPTEQERATATVRTSLGAETFAAHWAAGQAMGLEQAIEYALAVPKAPEAAPLTQEDNAGVLPTRTYPAGLTAREVEVLRLLAKGLTDAQIAEALVISRRTVNGHVASIYSKLGGNSRVVAARFAVENHLV